MLGFLVNCIFIFSDIKKRNKKNRLAYGYFGYIIRSLAFLLFIVIDYQKAFIIVNTKNKWGRNFWEIAEAML